ncbi:MAG: Ig-like domain-containing protein [bacterium]
MKIKKMTKMSLIIICLINFTIFAGAKAESSTPPEIKDLIASSATFKSVILAWTSPGENIATHYDIRYSTSNITSSTWNGAIQAYSEPLPQQAGSSQSMKILDLSPNTTYYFAMKVCEDTDCSSISNVVSLKTLEEPKNIVLINQCGELTLSNTYYILNNDVRCDGTCFNIKGYNVILDLNGHTITYDDYTPPDNNGDGKPDFPLGVPNADFELSVGDPIDPDNPSGDKFSATDDWDYSGAPTYQKRPTSDTTYNLMIHKQYLIFQKPTADQAIISPWMGLPPNEKIVVYFERAEMAQFYDINFLCELQYEEFGGGASGSMYSNLEDPVSFTRCSYEFTTRSNPAKYRLKFSYISPEYPTAQWQAIHSYKLGDKIYVPDSSGAPDGFLYYRVLKVNSSDGVTGVSGATKPPWNFSAETIDGQLIWGAYKAVTDLDIGVDLVDARPRDHYGIRLFYNYRGAITIKNGSIVQGKGRGFQSHTIYNNETPLVTLENLNIKTWGLEAESIHNIAPDCAIHHCTIVNMNPFKINRHQLSGAVFFQTSSNCNAHNNTIASDTGWGAVCMIGGSKNISIYDNILSSSSTITNHHTINSYETDNITISGNTIETDTGLGMIISSGCDNWKIFKNKFKSNGVRRGTINPDAIRINDYEATTKNSNIKIDNNEFFIIGDIDEYYGIPDSIHINGIMTRAGGPGISVTNNYIKVTVIDDNVCASGISPGPYDNEQIFENNIIESNSANVMLTSYSRKCYNATFIANTFIKGSNPKGICSDYSDSPPAYCTLSSRYCETSVRDTHFIDTTLANGASLEDFEMSRCLSEYSYFVDWYLNLIVKDISGNPVSGATVIITNKNGEEVFSGKTGPVGTINKILLNQFEHHGGLNKVEGINYSTPHKVVVSAEGYTTYEIKELNMNKSFQELPIVLYKSSEVNDAPIAQSYTIATSKNTSVPVSLMAIYQNMASLSYSLNDPLHGSLSGLAPNLIYTPDTDYVGSDILTFTVNDSKGGSDTGTITIEVKSVGTVITPPAPPKNLRLWN